jgi:outer membrane protein TolC
MKSKFLIIVGLVFLSVNVNAQVYNLDSFLDLVKKNNKDILLAAKELEMADAQDGMARSSAYPSLSATAGYNRNLKEAYLFVDFGDVFGPGMGGPSKFKVNYNNEFNASAILTQNVFNFSVFNAIKAAKQYETFSKHVYDASLKGVVNGSKKAFYQTLLLKEVFEVNKESEKNAHENYLNVKKKFDVGIVSELQLLQAEVNWKNSIPKLTQSERNYQLALNSLKTLAGVDVNKDFLITGELESVTKINPKMEFPDILENRSDYKARLWEMKLRETNVDVEYSGHLPTLSASLIYQYSALSDEFKLERENNYLIAGLSLNIPIFNGWMTSSKVQMAKIEVDKAGLQLSKFENDILIEIKNLELKLSEAEKRIESAESTLGISKKAFDIAEITSENGLATQLELKDARLAYDQAKLNYYSAQYEYLEAYFDWELAVGTMN